MPIYDYKKYGRENLEFTGFSGALQKNIKHRKKIETPFGSLRSQVQILSHRYRKREFPEKGSSLFPFRLRIYKKGMPC